jgi:DNA invertase Pin-like site-specific DNA recombinase
MTEALDLSTPSGRALAGMLAVFAEFERDLLRERVRGGLERARREGKHLGRPPTAATRATEILALRRRGLSHAEIARRLGIGETSVRRILMSAASLSNSRAISRGRSRRWPKR